MALRFQDEIAKQKLYQAERKQIRERGKSRMRGAKETSEKMDMARSRQAKHSQMRPKHDPSTRQTA